MEGNTDIVRYQDTKIWISNISFPIWFELTSFENAFWFCGLVKKNKKTKKVKKISHNNEILSRQNIGIRRGISKWKVTVTQLWVGTLPKESTRPLEGTQRWGGTFSWGMTWLPEEKGRDTSTIRDTATEIDTDTRKDRAIRKTRTIRKDRAIRRNVPMLSFLKGARKKHFFFALRRPILRQEIMNFWSQVSDHWAEAFAAEARWPAAQMYRKEQWNKGERERKRERERERES